MEHTVSNSAMIINLLIQVGQIGIFFGIFVYIYGSKISDAVHARQAKELKLANADAEYAAMIAKGKEEYNDIISQAGQLKQQILSEAEQLATRKSDEIIDIAHRRSDDIVARGQQEANNMEAELKSWYESMIKQTTTTVVNKLLVNNLEMYQKYIDTIVKQVV